MARRGDDATWLAMQDADCPHDEVVKLGSDSTNEYHRCQDCETVLVKELPEDAAEGPQRRGTPAPSSPEASHPIADAIRGGSAMGAQDRHSHTVSQDPVVRPLLRRVISRLRDRLR